MKARLQARELADRLTLVFSMKVYQYQLQFSFLFSSAVHWTHRVCDVTIRNSNALCVSGSSLIIQIPAAKVVNSKTLR